MARKREGLVPIGEVFGGLDGPVKELREASPQAVHHFTQADQVNQLVEASEADPDMGFMARTMALCSLPRTNPGNQLQYKRVNGPYKLAMIAGTDNKLPFGNLPRLLLAWVCTEAVRTQSRVLILGDSVSGFMRKLDIYSTSGEKYTRLRNQMDRLFHASVQLIYEDEGSKASVSSFVADRTEFWWDPKHPDERSLWKSKIRLGEDFFNEIISHPVPLDMNILKGPQAVLAGPGLVPVAHLPHLCPPCSTTALLAVALPAVRREPGQSGRQEYSEPLPHGMLAGAQEDQGGLAGVELRDGQGSADSLALEARHSSGRAAAISELTSNPPLTSQSSALTALRAPPVSLGGA